MTGLSILGSRLTGTLTTLTTPDDTAGVDAFNSTIRHRPDAVVRPAAAADVVETGRFARAEGRLNPGFGRTPPQIPRTSGQPGRVE
jgi:FAD/FMN-containing dehydrogenase